MLVLQVAATGFGAIGLLILFCALVFARRTPMREQSIAIGIILIWLGCGLGMFCFADVFFGRNELTEWRQTLAQKEKIRVGFDLDGTLIFSRANFTKAFAQTKPLSPECYALVNGSDEAYSKIRTPVKKILDKHRTRGDEIFVVTSRGPKNGDKLKEYLSFNFGVLPENVFFSTDDKTEVLKSLKLNLFYGDFDLDITSAQNEGAIPYRILLGEAEYQKPEKYNPGKFGETIIPGTEWVEPGKEDWNATIGESERLGNSTYYGDLALFLFAGLWGAAAIGAWIYRVIRKKENSEMN